METLDGGSSSTFTAESRQAAPLEHPSVSAETPADPAPVIKKKPLTPVKTSLDFTPKLGAGERNSTGGPGPSIVGTVSASVRERAKRLQPDHMDAAAEGSDAK